MTRLLVEFNADTETGIWPKRDATSPCALARDRGYDEIVKVLDAARHDRGARMPRGPSESSHKLQRAWNGGSEDAIVSVLEEHSETGVAWIGAAMCSVGFTLLALTVRDFEEPWLARTHGAAWRAYAARVPRWL